MRFVVRIEAFGRVSQRIIEADYALEAEAIGREQVGLKVEVAPVVDVEEQVRLANQEAAS